MVIFELKKQLLNILPREDAIELLKFVLDCDLTGLALRAQEQATNEQQEKLLSLAKEIQNGRPLQYVLGFWEFCGLKIKVNEDVLIPRADTELLAESAAELISDKMRVIDLCTGSGCIAAFLANCADCFVTAVELSKGAIEVAKENLNALTRGNFEVQRADVLLPPDLSVFRDYDILVSNPPYIRTDVIPSLDKNVQNEPITALDGGKDGLDFYRAIAKEWKRVIKPDGKILLEIGFDQANEVAEILKNNGFCNIKLLTDSGGNDRVIIGTLKT